MDNQHARRRPLTLAACMIYPGLTFGLMVGTYPQIVRPLAADLHTTQTAAIACFAMGTAIVMLASALVGRLLERMSVAVLVGFGAALLTLGLFLITRATAIWQVGLLFGTLTGFGLAFCSEVTSQSVAVRLYPTSPGMMVGCVTLGLHLGGAGMSVAFGMLLHSLGWRSALQIDCLVVALIVPLIALTMLRGRLDSFGPKLHVPPVIATTVTTRQILNSPSWRALIIGLFPMPLTMATVQLVMATLVAQSGLSSDVTGLLVAQISLGTAVGTFTTGWLADRVALRLLYPAIALGPLFALLIFSSRASFPLLCVGALVGGFSQGGVMPVIGAAIIRRFGPALFARVFSLVLPGMAILSLGPIVAMAVHERTGSFNFVFIGFAALIVLGTAAMAREGLRPAH